MYKLQSIPREAMLRRCAANTTERGLLDRVDPNLALWSVLSAAVVNREWIGYEYNGRGYLPHRQRTVV